MVERKGRFLVLEFKEGGAPIRLGQRLTLKRLVAMGMDVWVVWGPDDHDMVQVGAMDRYGDVKFVERMKTAKLRNRVATWYEEVDRNGEGS